MQDGRLGKLRFSLQVYAKVTFLLILLSPSLCQAWHDETHIAIAKAAGYYKWFNATGADMAKIKAGKIESHNHYVNNSADAVITAEVVLNQVKKYNLVDPKGHLYGAIIASLRDYFKERRKGKYGEYHLAFCAHYVGDLSQPLHNTAYDTYNLKFHDQTDGVINDEILENLQKIKISAVDIDSEEALAKEIAKIAKVAMELGYRLRIEGRQLRKQEAYVQVSQSVSLFKAILAYAERSVK
jgi:hypothetical protein